VPKFKESGAGRGVVVNPALRGTEKSRAQVPAVFDFSKKEG